MAKKFDRWFAGQVAESIRTCRIGSVLLIPGALFVAFLTYWVVWLTILMGFGVLLNLSWTTIYVLAAVFLIVLFAWQFTAGRNFKETYRFAGKGPSTIELNVAQMTGNDWVVLLEPGVASGLIRVVSMLYLTAPRMVALSIMLHNRSERLKKMDVDACAKVMAHLITAQARVPFEQIEAAFPDADLSQIVQPLADVDGVVFLQKGEPALTVAPRVVEEYETWAQSR